MIAIRHIGVILEPIRKFVTRCFLIIIVIVIVIIILFHCCVIAEWVVVVFIGEIYWSGREGDVDYQRHQRHQ